MLKFNYVVNLGLAMVLVVPAVTLGVQRNESLEVTLQRTVLALERLASVEKRLEQRDPTAVAEAARLTETPIATPANEPGASDALLEHLRQEVADLQLEVDALEGGAPNSTRPQPDAHEVEAPITVGLDDLQRQRMSGSILETIRSQSAPPPKPPQPMPPKTEFEDDGYAADPLKLGRALYRQARYEQALASLDASSSVAEVVYWRARCLEKLGRDAEAHTAYEKVRALDANGPWSERAKQDLEFLKWRGGLEKPKAGGARE